MPAANPVEVLRKLIPFLSPPRDNLPGVAVLAKESAILFTPVLAYALYVARRERHFYRFGVSSWLYGCLALLSYDPLFAILKGELFPLAPHGPQHVSLLGYTLVAGRAFARPRHAGTMVL